jgi:rhodanese-related sulfurtransferase
MSKPLEIDISSLSDDELAEYQVIDIRDKVSTFLSPLKLAGAVAIPSRKFASGGLPAEISKDKQYLLSCYHGNISMGLVQHLRAQGHENFFSLAGGHAGVKLR